MTKHSQNEREDYANIPAELRERKQWVCSRADKRPVMPDGKPASVSDPMTWSTFDACSASAEQKSGWGVGFVFTEADPFAVVDLDHVRNPNTGETESSAQAIIDELASYTEVSRSGTGWHIIIRATLPGPGRKREHVEVYDRRTVMTLTGDTILGFGSEEVVERDLTKFYAQLEERDSTVANTSATSGDSSADDFAVACKAARESGCDFVKTRAEFLRTANPRKKLNRQDYVDRTVKNAIATIMTSKPIVEPKKEAAGTDTPSDDVPQKHWREAFHTGSELDNTPGRVFIKGILEEGITFIGAHSSVGKTWMGLSISHALLSGHPLFGVFPVLTRTNVIYLVPEMGGRKFRERMQKMRISMDGGFFCQTVKDGACDLEDRLLAEAVRDLNPVVVLDTAIRFQAGDEQSSTQQAQGLGAKMFKLINAGAQAIICMHHRKKDLGDLQPTLANTLRGTGDFGAMADCVWCMEHARKRKGKTYDDDYEEESRQLTRLTVTCVKPRDMEPADPFTVQGRPYIDQKGDFVVLDSHSETAPEPPESKEGDEKVVELVTADPSIGILTLRKKTGFGDARVKRVIEDHGYVKENGLWVRKPKEQERLLPDVVM